MQNYCFQGLKKLMMVNKFEKKTCITIKLTWSYLIVFEALIDPHKRAIYDSVGIKGLEQDGLQLVVRSKTPKEIREEYERLAKEREEKRIQKLTFSEVP